MVGPFELIVPCTVAEVAVIDVAGPVCAWAGRTAAVATLTHNARSNAVLIGTLARSRSRWIGRDVRRACGPVIQMVIPAG